jgi:hypothetical protein
MMRPRLTPWLIGLVCVGPLGLAALLYYGPWDLRALPQLPGSRELVIPPTKLPPLVLAGPNAARAPSAGPYRWSLIYARMTDCEEQCQSHLGRLRQVHQALGAEADRVQRLFVHAGDAPRLDEDDNLQLRRFDASGSLWRQLGEERLTNGRIFIADPLGNLVVSYPSDVEQKELLRDFERLLEASGIG